MNKKGQVEANLGTFLVVFITLIVGVVLFLAISQEVGGITSTVSVVNQSETLTTNGNSIYIEEWKSLTGVTIINLTTNGTIPATNYTVTNNALNPTTGALSVQITTDDAAHASSPVVISGTAQPLTYIANSAARSITLLIGIFFALSIAVVALTPTLQSKILSMVGK